MKQFAVAGEKAGSVGPHCPALLAQAKLHREPVQLQQAERYIYCIVLLYYVTACSTADPGNLHASGPDSTFRLDPDPLSILFVSFYQNQVLVVKNKYA